MPLLNESRSIHSLWRTVTDPSKSCNGSGAVRRPVPNASTAAKASVSALLTDLGFEPLDAGDLTKARLLEPFGMLWINQALVRGKGRDWAFAAVHREGKK